MKRLSAWSIGFIVFLVCFSVFLFLRARNEYRWSDWGAGDAQSILAVNQWEKQGWLESKLLFTPQGYAKAGMLLDDAQLRHHAHGISAPTPHNIGPRLRYTHYPAGYLVPYAFLFRWGEGNIFLLRSLSVLLSVGALALMYILFSLILAPRTAFLAVFFYGLSGAFLGYADSLANQPMDDFFRFAFMLCTVLSTRLVSARAKKVLLISAWVIEFSLSLSSFDSVFFVFAWLIGWDFIERRGFCWKKYLVFALAPLSAHFLGFLQNVWYLGLNDALTDIKDTFIMKSWPYGTAGRLAGMGYILAIVFSNLYRPLDLLVVMAVLYLLYRKFVIPKEENSGLPSPRLLAVLCLCGLVFIFVFPVAATMRYESRQVAPFLAVLVSGCTWAFLRVKKKIYFSLFGIAVVLFWALFVFLDREPVFNDVKIKNHPSVLLAKRIRPIPTAHEPVFFSVGGFNAFLNARYVPGYPQIQPIVEHYLGNRLVLCFDRPEALAADLSYLIHRSREKFSPVLIAGDIADIEKVLRFLTEQGQCKAEQERIYYIRDKYVMALGRSLIWK